ncbi:hypothetical protein R1flu_018651 [Riccia fluitans]|uniref:Germin-like protein n=1 Tax=Riccia fluitans TaxID=41844 RepID=A0ABD1ZGM3_9MARC
MSCSVRCLQCSCSGSRRDQRFRTTTSRHTVGWELLHFHQIAQHQARQSRSICKRYCCKCECLSRALDTPSPERALSGLGVSNALLVYPPGSVNVPHTHPRGTETLFIIEGTLEVGLIDTTAPVPVLFTQTLQKDDIFVLPRGLVHFQINKSQKTVRAYASFSSTNPGLVSLPRTLFGVNVDIDVLTKSFQVPPYMIKALSAQQS